MPTLTPVKTERQAALVAAMGKLNAKFEHAVVSRGVTQRAYEVVSSGVSLLDRLLEIKGYPKGLITEIFGPEGTRKTTLALKSAATVQQAGGLVGFLDCSHSLDARAAKKLGVDVNAMVYVNPLSPSEAWESAEALLETKSLDLFIVDGFGALRSQSMKGGEQSKTSLLSGVIRNLGIWAAQSNTAVVITRRMNPNLSMAAAADEVIRKTAQVRVEMILKAENPRKTVIKLHKNVPAGHLQEDDPKHLEVSLE